MPELYSHGRGEDLRFPFLNTIEYLCGNEMQKVPFKAVTINISKSGICMYMFDSSCVDQGNKIEIKSDLPISARIGTIRWVDKVKDGFYKAGLKFI